MLSEYDTRTPRSLGESDLVASCRALKDKFIIRSNNPPHAHGDVQLLNACRNVRLNGQQSVRLNGQQSVSHDCTICSELADEYESGQAARTPFFFGLVALLCVESHQPEVALSLDEPHCGGCLQAIAGV